MSSASIAKFYPNVRPLDAIRRVLKAAAGVPVAGEWVRDMPARALDPRRNDNVDPLWTGGYKRWHNRYVRRDSFPAYHVSDGVTTAAAEVFGIRPSPSPILGVPSASRLQLVVAVELENVLDLTDSAARKRLRVSKAALTEIPDWTSVDRFDRPLAYELPQAIGEIANKLGFSAIQYPAARATKGKNLVVFRSQLGPTGGHLSTTNPFTGLVHRLP